MSEEFSSDEYEAHIKDLQQYIEKQGAQNIQYNQSLAANAYASKDSNLIAFQIDSPELLSKLEHFYRGDFLHTDEESGDIVWKKQKDRGLIPLNEYGVSLLMETVTKYVDKNTNLSVYEDTRINEILADLGDELTLVIFCNYEKMGMDTNFKKTKFRLIVVTTLHLIESAYRRSVGGKTLELLNQSKLVTQSDMLGRPQMDFTKKKSWYNPKRW